MILSALLESIDLMVGFHLNFRTNVVIIIWEVKVKVKRKSNIK
jgi:hypothetical protein